MQPQDESDKCTEKGVSDGGRDVERSTLENALALAVAVLSSMGNRPVRVNDDGTVNLSASLKGSGGTSA